MHTRALAHHYQVSLTLIFVLILVFFLLATHLLAKVYHDRANDEGYGLEYDNHIVPAPRGIYKMTIH